MSASSESASRPTMVARVADLTAELQAAAMPVVLTDTSRAWPARDRWSFDWLRDAHGDVTVNVVDVDAGAIYMDPRRGLVARPSTMGAFVRALRERASPGYLMTDLADLPRALSDDAPFPPIAARAFWRTSRLWISSAGTVSGLHFDVAHNLHTVISGAKRFTLYPFRQWRHLYPRGLFASMPNASRVDLDAPDYARFPRLRRARAVVAEVGDGDTLFIPGGWWHHVRTMSDTIAVNTFYATGMRGAAVVASDLFKRMRRLSR